MEPQLRKLIATLRTLPTPLKMTGQEIAEVIWLALAERRAEEQFVIDVSAETVFAPSDLEEEFDQPPDQPPDQKADNSNRDTSILEPNVNILPSPVDFTPSLALPPNYKPIFVPNPPAIANALQIARLLRPLARQVSVGVPKILDEMATVDLIAETGVWQPVLKPATELWLEVALVWDTSPSMALWQRFSKDLEQVLSHYGEFRDLRVWKLRDADHQPVQLLALDGSVHNPRELLSGEGRRIVMVVSDCVASAWHDGRMRSLIGIWAEKLPTVVVQVFPERLWSRTALARSMAVELQGKPFHESDNQLNSNSSLKFYARSYWDQKRLERQPKTRDPDSKPIDTNLRLPVLTIELDALQDWVKMVLGDRAARVAGIVWLDQTDTPPKTVDPDAIEVTPTPTDRVDSFLLTASPTARELAALLASAPVITLPIVRLVQRAMLPQSTAVHVAEVWMSGLLKLSSAEAPTFENAERLAYQLVDDQIRDRLRAGFPVIDGLIVLERVSEYVAKGLGKSITEFRALLQLPHALQVSQPETEFLSAFAKVTASILRGLGSEFNEIADRFALPTGATETTELDILEYEVAEFISFPDFADFEFEAAQIIDILERFEFETAKVEWKTTRSFGNLGFGRPKRQLQINRSSASNWGYTEVLSDKTGLEMALVPSGTFVMGAPENEPESLDRERPQHEVTVPSFYLGRYLITQAQWQAVAAWPRIHRDLDPNPSYFKGEHLPVEQVSWDDATEFCQRLSVRTGKGYRLPSEAEWEYACRAGTTTPFHFGETITPEIANYNGRYTYNDGPKGDDRGKTTAGGIFPANDFGLHDLHGNVWEWCQDHWPGSYMEAPSDGSAWLSENDNHSHRLLRGGSWGSFPRYCRSACRYDDARDYRSYDVGFRVCCELPRLLSP